MVAKVGFREAKRRVLEALRSGDYQSQSRAEIDTKNLLYSGEVTEDVLCGIIEICRGQDHSVSAHHAIRGVDVHILRKSGWYVKFYFLEESSPSTVFISVHR